MMDIQQTVLPRARFARGDASDTTVAPWLSAKRLELIILPTEKCNFRCSYCYETFAIGRMQLAVQEAVCRLIASRDDLDQLEISWFGGEPLLGLPVIRKIGAFAHAFADKYGIALLGSMTTNGYLLGPDTAHWLIDHGVRRFQVSLDGDRDVHNRTRRRADGSGTFDRIFDNLTSMAESTQRFDVMLRLHFHRENLSSVAALAELLAERFGGDSRFSVFFASVNALGGAGDAMFPFLTDAEAKERVIRGLASQVAGRLRVINHVAQEPKRPQTMPPASTSAQQVEKCGATLGAQGLRPIRMRVPDTHAPGFIEECARQAAIVDTASRADSELMQFMDAAAADLAEHLDALEAGHRE